MKALTTFISKASKQLQIEYNVTDTRANNIINKYIDIVYNEIANKALYDNDIPNTHRASVFDIAKKYKPMINGKRVYIHYWLNNNVKKLRLFSIVEEGIPGLSYSAIKLHYKMDDFINKTYHNIIHGHPIDRDAVVNNFYGKFADLLKDSTMVDVGPINLHTLKQYIDGCLDEKRKRYAKQIYILAYMHSGKLLQIKVHSEFGRTYYKGVNLQKASKEVRYAALGNCVEYDLNNAAIVYRLNEANKIDDTEYPYTNHYIKNKKLIRNMIATEVKVDVSDIKEVFTLIGFGGRGTRGTGYNPNGKALAVNSVLDKEQRKKFYDCEFVNKFLKEQRYMAKIIYKKYRYQFTDITREQTLAYLYQHNETEVMNKAFSHIPEDTILLKCHDAYYLRSITKQDLKQVREKLTKQNQLLTISETNHTGGTI